MYIYNVTTNIDDLVHDKWIKWMQEEHIPAMMATGKFSAAKMCRVLVTEEMGGKTYSVQYTAASKEMLELYYKEDAPRLRQEGLKLFADKMIAFRTELEVISEQ
ncbi:DUF4286 family protein [Cellulophaga tyrosinoxydans]|uniref:DUF4286 domain-containing protein n=1 Tax=Cellulophaga tyrosinoxydans TaxID=504486 RepID=A0A1W1YIR7_9FLAO|nr:DUF4286 family protein [Cellulophaga tyrosinoxydans]SMC35701.1 protein of unknown function [Cellulophaga tyrosinoxydans]|tara:strand:- start:20 stop:331 length:312 start_codon:yes stop_codon:yes gene_type:complete